MHRPTICYFKVKKSVTVQSRPFLNGAMERLALLLMPSFSLFHLELMILISILHSTYVIDIHLVLS